MRLTTLTDYAMRLLMYVGQHPERLCTIAEIAAAYNISEPHLMKVTHKLSVKGWLTTVRGKNGGMKLAKPPSEINLGAVVRDTENDFHVVECLGTDSTCTLGGYCALTGIMEGALQKFLEHLGQYTLADILPANEKVITLMQSDRTEL